MEGISKPTDAFEYPTINMTASKLDALTYSLIGAGVDYELGAKADPLSLQAGQFDSIDCSGFVRWAIYHATDHQLVIPDGSYNQHAWVQEQGFKPSVFEDGFLKDGAIRIAFLNPQYGGGVGHVMFINHGETCESHGGHGPDFRGWGSEEFMAKCHLYVLVAPSELRSPAGKAAEVSIAA